MNLHKCSILYSNFAKTETTPIKYGLPLTPTLNISKTTGLTHCQNPLPDCSGDLSFLVGVHYFPPLYFFRCCGYNNFPSTFRQSYRVIVVVSRRLVVVVVVVVVRRRRLYLSLFRKEESLISFALILEPPN